MAKKIPVTRAIRALRAASMEYSEHPFDYERHPGAEGASAAVGVDPHLTTKTIVFTTDDGGAAVVLMHGDLEVSTKELARIMEVKSVRPATQREADRVTGYRFGGTSPLGMRTDPPVFAQQTLLNLERVYVNGGRRGLLIGIEPDSLVELTGARLVDVAVDRGER